MRPFILMMFPKIQSMIDLFKKLSDLLILIMTKFVGIRIPNADFSWVCSNKTMDCHNLLPTKEKNVSLSHT